MNIALISSTIDPASVNIKDKLLKSELFSETEESFSNHFVYSASFSDKEAKLYTISEPLIHANTIDADISADVFIFLSKHRAEEGRASLTVHPIGNFGKADYGGEDGKLCICPTGIFKDIFSELIKAVEGSEYEATLEATHHGPYVDKQVLFLELGSNEKHWNDSEGAEMLVAALIAALKKKSETYDSVILLGGSHYSHVGGKVMLQSHFSVSHMMPKYNFDALDVAMLQQMVEKTDQKPAFVLLDWKGLGTKKQHVLDVLEKADIKHKRSDHFFKEIENQ